MDKRKITTESVPKKTCLFGGLAKGGNTVFSFVWLEGGTVK
jgi:hypothetical protein